MYVLDCFVNTGVRWKISLRIVVDTDRTDFLHPAEHPLIDGSGVFIIELGTPIQSIPRR
jgi:hypothetical protein